MKKIISILAISILALTGCGSTTSESDVVTINMAAMNSISQLPYLYAEENGMFEEAGIDMNIQLFNSAKDRNAAWDTGDYTVEVGDLTSGAILSNLGEDITITGSPETTYKLVANPEISESFDGDFSSLDGMSVGLSENTVIEFYVDIVADMYDIEFDKVAMPDIPGRYSALISGDLDLAILPDPFPSMAAEDGGDIIWTSTDSSDIPQISALNWNENFDDMDTISKVIEITNEASQEMNELGPDSYRDIAIANNMIDEAYFDAVTADLVFTESVVPSVGTWEAVVDWTNAKGITEDVASHEEIMFAQ